MKQNKIRITNALNGPLLCAIQLLIQIQSPTTTNRSLLQYWKAI